MTNEMDTAAVKPEDEMIGRMFLPPIKRGMRVLDRSFFQKNVQITAAIVNDPKMVAAVKKACEKDLVRDLRIIPVKTELSSEGQLQVMRLSKGDMAQSRKDEEPIEQFKKLIPLYPRVKPDEPSTICPGLLPFIESKIVDLALYEVRMEYKDWDYHQIITSVLPEELLDEVPSGFTQSGHMAHLNLREPYLPYKHIIGQVILDKALGCKTVVNKTEEVGVSSEFRTFGMEILAGEPITEVELIESGCKFKFDFAKVYWNSRLSTEHQRIIDMFKEGEAVADIMAGVGPFAVPAGKKRVFVCANDLNPESYKALVENIDRNKVGDFVKAYNEDGRDFIRTVVKTLYKFSTQWGEILVHPKIKYSRSNPIPPDQKPPPKIYHIPPTFNHFVMNLPATAVEFLDSFIGVYTGMEALFEPHTNRELPLIHLHIFDQPHVEDARGSICQRISKYLNYTVDLEDVDLKDVRLVAPKKRMYCATFRLPRQVAFAGWEGRKGMEEDPSMKISGLDVKAWMS